MQVIEATTKEANRLKFGQIHQALRQITRWLYIYTAMTVIATCLRNTGLRLKQCERRAAQAVRGNLPPKDWPANNDSHGLIRAPSFAQFRSLLNGKVARIIQTKLFIARLALPLEGERHEEGAKTWMAVFA